MYKKIHILIILLAFCIGAKAQDPVFSQPFVAAQFLSPASVGSGGYENRFQSNTRSQFIGGNNLYRTIAVGWDTRFSRKDPELLNYLGIGTQIISDQVMGGIMQTNYVSLNLAYHLFLDNDAHKNFALGLGTTFANTSLDKSRLRFGDQYDYTATYTGNGSLDLLKPFPSKFSVNAGVLYSIHSEQLFFQIGANAFFFSKPEVTYSLYNESSGLRKTMFVSVEKTISDIYTIMAHASYGSRNNVSQYFGGGAVGLPLSYKWNEVRRLYIGCFYRVGDAVIPSVSLMLNNYNMGLSYDFYNNSLSGASIKQNGFEITLSTSFGKKRHEFLRTLFD